MNRILVFAVTSSLFAGISQAGSVSFGSLTVPGLNAAATTFVFSGTLTQTSTISFTASGNPNDPCLQSAGMYCTNAAGVITTAGTSPVGVDTTFTGTFNGTSGTWVYGSLIMEISGEGAVQVFPTTSANGLGSATPPTTLTLASTTLAALGFSGSFSLVNPTIGFIVADDFFSDNTNGFLLSQPSPGVPEPASWVLLGLGLVALAVIRRRRRAV